MDRFSNSQKSRCWSWKLIVWEHESKQRKVAVEYVKLCGYKHGEIGNGREKKVHNGLSTQMSLDEIASQLGTSKTNLKRALSIERNLTEPMKQLLDDGVISKTVAADLLETNILQRGDVGGSAKKVGKRIKELERIYGIKQGGSGFYGNSHVSNIESTNNSETLKTQEQLATQMGNSVDKLQNYKLLADMIPELEDLVDTGCLFLI